LSWDIYRAASKARWIGTVEATDEADAIATMTLGNMRQNSVRGLFVICSACGYHAEVNVDAWPDDVPVPSFGPRMPCTKPGHLGGNAIPNRIERRDDLPRTLR
jgi:hypothetical protein